MSPLNDIESPFEEEKLRDSEIHEDNTNSKMLAVIRLGTGYDD